MKPKIKPINHTRETTDVLAAIDAIAAHNPNLNITIYTKHGNRIITHAFFDEVRHEANCLVTQYQPIEDGQDEGDTFPWCTCFYRHYPTNTYTSPNGNRTEK
jgi:hypothetical protein